MSTTSGTGREHSGDRAEASDGQQGQRDLRRATSARVEIGTTATLVRPEILSGSDRDRVWSDVVVHALPDVVKYERKSGRIIPVALLRPVQEGGAPAPSS